MADETESEEYAARPVPLHLRAIQNVNYYYYVLLLRNFQEMWIFRLDGFRLEYGSGGFKEQVEVTGNGKTPSC